MKIQRHHARKRFGQNFLIDENIIEHIVSVIAAQADDHIVEIGPGLGALTQEILAQTGKIDVIELDRDVIPKLEHNCKGLGELNIHQADVLQFDFNQLVDSEKKLRIVGNLPYNISTPLLFHLLDYKSLIQDMFFMLQKEVVDRICADVGASDYGRLTVMLQYHMQTNHLFDVPPESFKPAPKVNSAIINLMPYTQPPYQANNYEVFAKLVHHAFSHRRKTIKNNLKDVCDNSILELLNISPQARPQELSVQNYVDLANFINTEI